MNEEVQVEVSTSALISDERNPAEGNNEIPPPNKLPPTPEELIGNDMLWLIAKVCHEVNRAYCAAVLNDFTSQPWEITSAEQRNSVYEGVMYVLNNGDVSAAEIHGAWMEHKLMQGWVYGNMKDDKQKTHPCLMPFHQLHAHDRAKDDIFLTICKTMLGK